MSLLLIAFWLAGVAALAAALAVIWWLVRLAGAPRKGVSAGVNRQGEAR